MNSNVEPVQKVFWKSSQKEDLDLNDISDEEIEVKNIQKSPEKPVENVRVRSGKR